MSLSPPVTGRAVSRNGSVELLLTIPLSGPPDPPPQPARGHDPGGDGPAHGPGFAWVRWGGVRYEFHGQKQRAVVAALWRARESGDEFVLAETLLHLADSDGGKVRDLFRRHPAWGAMIACAHGAGGPPGSYRLADGE